MASCGRGSIRTCATVAAASFVIAYAPVAHAYHEGDERIIDGTAHTLRAGEIRAGLGELELGPTAFVTVGTDVEAWAASFVLQALVVNAHAKLRLLHTAPLTISIYGGAYRAAIPASGPVIAGTGSLLLVPASIYTSSDLTKRVSLHLGVTYAHVEADGEVQLAAGNDRARAALATSAVQLHAMLECRVTRVVAITIAGHAQPVTSAPAVHISSTTAYGDHFDFVGTVAPVDRTAVAAAANVVLSGRNMNLRIGGGYGAIFLPSMGVMIPFRTGLPELDAYVRF
jgi:hypothetical protein